MTPAIHVETGRIHLSSAGFEAGAAIPKKYTADGRNVSPPLAWGPCPEGTRSLALICEDPDAPGGAWTHWVLFNLPGETRDLAEHIPPTGRLPSGALQGRNDFGHLGYGGPAPPRGKTHRYFFRLFALAESLELEPGAKKAEVLARIGKSALAEGELMGTYQR